MIAKSGKICNKIFADSGSSPANTTSVRLLQGFALREGQDGRVSVSRRIASEPTNDDFD